MTRTRAWTGVPRHKQEDSAMWTRDEPSPGDEGSFPDTRARIILYYLFRELPFMCNKPRKGFQVTIPSLLVIVTTDGQLGA
jgi:hypothetical protein